jgi:hypothetical protein
MSRSKVVVSAAGWLLFFIVSGASAVESRKPLDGYACMSLKHEQTYNEWIASRRLPKPPGGPDEPPVYRAPTEESERVGYQTNLVIAKWPLDKVNGFVRILWGQKGIPAWISADLIVPYHNAVKPSAKCTPLRMANGNISFWIE